MSGTKIDGDFEVSTPTGEQRNTYRIVNYPFDNGKFDVQVVLSSENKFLGITEIKLSKSFVEKTPKGYHDVGEFYKD